MIGVWWNDVWVLIQLIDWRFGGTRVDTTIVRGKLLASLSSFPCTFILVYFEFALGGIFRVEFGTEVSIIDSVPTIN